MLLVSIMREAARPTALANAAAQTASSARLLQTTLSA